ncbi:MAG: mycofactocin precursor MftA [Ilumatobacteraceae bacterium]
MEPATTIDLGTTATLVASDDTAADDVLVEDELLVEEISIDGMCGVY